MDYPEPTEVRPEAEFERTLCVVAKQILRAKGIQFVAIPKFGLDIAFFIRGVGATEITSRIIEFKSFVGGRPGGVGFGTPLGSGPQVELLLQPPSDLEMLAPIIRWALVDATLPHGARRYVLLDSRSAKKTAMGEVEKGKQNNFLVSALRQHMTEWSPFIADLEHFLVH